jgi:hypothetical protein
VTRSHIAYHDGAIAAYHFRHGPGLHGGTYMPSNRTGTTEMAPLRMDVPPLFLRENRVPKELELPGRHGEGRSREPCER